MTSSVSLTPEQIATITTGATPVQQVTLFLLGLIALGVVILIVRWIIQLKLGTLPADIAAIRAGLNELGLQIAKIQAELWSRDEIDDRINAALKEHIERCPHRHNPKED